VLAMFVPIASYIYSVFHKIHLNYVLTFPRLLSYRYVTHLHPMWLPLRLVRTLRSTLGHYTVVDAAELDCCNLTTDCLPKFDTASVHDLNKSRYHLRSIRVRNIKRNFVIYADQATGFWITLKGYKLEDWNS